LASSAIAVRIVVARSRPRSGRYPRLASMETVKAVLKADVLSETINGSCSCRTLSSVRESRSDPPVLRHEINGLGRRLFGGDAQVPFIFPIFVIHEDDYFPLRMSSKASSMLLTGIFLLPRFQKAVLGQNPASSRDSFTVGRPAWRKNFSTYLARGSISRFTGSRLFSPPGLWSERYAG